MPRISDEASLAITPKTLVMTMLSLEDTRRDWATFSTKVLIDLQSRMAREDESKFDESHHDDS